MSLRSVLDLLSPRAARAGLAAPRRRPAFRPRLEALENRLVPSAYLQTNLAADQAGVAQIHDPELIEAWGISISTTATGTFWVSARATDVSTVYTGDVTRADGTISPLVKSALTVAIPGGAPTGQVFSGSATDFVVTSGTNSGPARFIFATDTGDIDGWNATVPSPPAPSRISHLMATTDDAVYTGLAIANNGEGNFLYAADFRNNRIDVFDRTYAPTTLDRGFVDPDLPEGYSAFNVWNLGGLLYVTYARQEDGDAIPDGGSGFVSVFDADGNFLSRVVSEDHLDRPWGLALAPGNYGEFSNALLVGNFGDGTISAYNPATGAFLGQLRDGSGEVIVIEGLLGLHFGNGTASGDRHALYFAAAPDGGAHGLFGSLRLLPARVADVAVNDSSDQRSMVKSLTVTFDGPVTLGEGAFEVRRADGSLVEFTVSASDVNGRTVAVLTFIGEDLIGGSLADGTYTLTVEGDSVLDAMGRALDGDGDGTAGDDHVSTFSRLYGDGDGDGDVDEADRDQFRSAFGTTDADAAYLWYLDFDGDGDVDGRDNGQFNRRFDDF